jgi:hypothetical protein
MGVGSGTGAVTGRGRRRGARALPRTAAALLALSALAALAGCTQDPEPDSRRLPSGPVGVADVRLVRVADCDALLDVVAAREAALERRLEELAGTRRAGDGGAVAPPDRAAAESRNRDSSIAATGPGDAPVSTVPSAMATGPGSGAGDPAGPGASAEERAAARGGTDETGGTVIVGTNNQEQGVDEGDLVKTDGRRLVALSSDGVLRVVLLDDDPAVDGTLPLLPGASAGGYPVYGPQGQLLLRGDGLVAVVGTWEPSHPVTHVMRIDLSDAAAPRVVEHARVVGEPVATRMVGGTVRIVVRPMLGGPAVDPGPLPQPVEPIEPARPIEPIEPARPVEPTTTEPGTTTPSTTSRVIAEPDTTTAGTDDAGAAVPGQAARLLPQRLTATGELEPLGGCDDVVSPPVDDGAASPGSAGVAVDVAGPTAQAVTVLTVGDTLGDLAPITVEGGAETVYAATDALYTTSTTYGPDGPVTAVHRFDLTADGPAAYTGSGVVPGTLLNQYSLSDRDGAVRVVTTTMSSPAVDLPATADDGLRDGAGPEQTLRRPARSTSAGRLTVLRPDADRTLREVGHLDDLGVGEEVKSVRFVEDRAYVVTFRRTDPLFAVDLSDDAAPRLLGELKLPGFSEYLHPIGDGRLVGIGSEADERTGVVTGFKATLFDVADPTAPKELDSFVEPGAWSPVGADPHSFTWDPVRRRAVVPVSTSPDGTCPPDAVCALPAEPAPIGRTTDGGVVGASGATSGGAPDDVASTTLACLPDTDCAPRLTPRWNGVYVLGIEDDSLVLKATLAHRTTGVEPALILRSVVVDRDLWTVSDEAIGRTDADRLDGVALLPFR